MSTHSRRIARNASVVGASTLASRVLGFARDLITAFALGAGPMADAFFVAFRVPNLLRRLFAEGSLTMAFVPVFSRIRREEGDAEAFAMARSTLAWQMAILGALTALAIAFAPLLTRVVAPGFTDDPEVFGLTVTLVRICFPYVILISAVALCMGVLNSMNHFLAPALSPCLLNIALIVAALLGHFLGRDVALAMAWGVLAGGLAQLAMQHPFLRARGFSWRGKWSWKHPGVARVGRLMGPTVFGAAVYQLNIVLGTLLASFLPSGSVSYLYYADRLVQFPLGIFGLAISTAALPSLAALAAERDMEGFEAALGTSLGLTLFISLPSAAGLIALADPVIALLFQRGAFTAADASATSLALVGYAAGLPAIILVRPLVSAFYALEDTRTPVAVATLCVALNIGLGALLMQWYLHLGLAVAVSVSGWLNALLLGLALHRRTGRFPALGRSLLVSLVLSAGVGVGAWFTRGLGWWSLALIPAWSVVYVWLCILMRLPEAELIREMVRNRLARGRSR